MSRRAINWEYVLSEAAGWISNICECGHPDSCHRPSRSGRLDACGEKDCYGDGSKCNRFKRVALTVVRGGKPQEK